MCGITGIVMSAGAPVERPIIERMTEALRHRGPDAGGVHVEGNVALGSRRLSVIDPSSAANQPFRDEAGAIVVTFNGEIYNYQQLRKELEPQGHRFRTHSDTEVLLRCWQAYGPEMLSRLRGMFALAVLDLRAGTLFVARDRLGKKPLYYSSSPDRLVFASEIKALLTLPGLSREMAESALCDYAAYGYAASDQTVFRQIRQLLPGHSLCLDIRPAALDPRIERYWDLAGEPDRSRGDEEWLQRLDEAIAESVRLRMISDVPLGAFLSGGIDSSLIVAHMARQAPGRVETFSIGFDDEQFDESHHARAVADHLGTDHHQTIVKPDAIRMLPALVATYDEPFADQSAIPTYHLSQMTRQHVTVALSGDGGDELFYGYNRYRESLLTHRVARCLTPVGRGMARSLSRAFPSDTSARRALGRLSHVGFNLYHDAMGYREEFLGLLRRELRERLPDSAGTSMAAAFRHGRQRTLPERYRYMDILNYLPQDILVKVDRASMRHSLEVRCPLLDHRIVELAMRIPPEIQMGMRRQKLLFRRLAERYVPRELLDRPKRGFSVPLNRWFREELAPIFREVLDHRSSPMWEYFDPQTAQQRFEDHLAGKSTSGDALWRLLYFHRWAEVFLAEPTNNPPKMPTRVSPATTHPATNDQGR